MTSTSTTTPQAGDGPALQRGVMPPTRPCDCLEQVNEKLAERGYHLAVRDIVRFSKDGEPSTEVGTAPLLMTEKLNSKSKGRAPSVYGPFCMFCGQRRWPAA